jgi:cardiolipin synthase
MQKRQQGLKEESELRFSERLKTEFRSSPGVSPLYKHIPNNLTMVRLFGTPVILWLIFQETLTTAFWIFFAMSATDWLDGYLARRWQATSRLGQILDPLADKFLLISVYLTLGMLGYIPLWVTSLVLIRDFFILTLSGVIISRQKKKTELAPHWMGKISTTIQMVLIGLVLARGAPILSIPTSSIESILMVIFLYGMALTTILSGFTYGWIAFKALRS